MIFSNYEARNPTTAQKFSYLSSTSSANHILQIYCQVFELIEIIRVVENKYYNAGYPAVLLTLIYVVLDSLPI